MTTSVNTAPQQNDFVLTAQHQAYGTVRFVIQATDARSAFANWKQIVSRPGQWNVRSNEEEKQ